MTCVMCGGNTQSKNVKFTADLGECVLVVKGVPANVCSQCGEYFFADNVSDDLEKIVGVAQNSTTEMYVTNYTTFTAKVA